MANTQSTIELLITADSSQAQAGIENLSGRFSGLAKAAAPWLGGAALAAGFAMVGKAAWDLASDVDAASDAIIMGTRASGAALEEMTQSAIDLSATSAGLGRSMEDIGKVIADVNTRTGATGDSLESFSAQILKMSRLTGVDANEAVTLVTRTMGDWGVTVDDSAALMDKLYSSTQVFGIGLPAISAKLVQFGAPLRQMGFTIDESIALLGKWEKEGVNTELVLGSLRIAAGKFAEEGIDLRVGLDSVIERIQGAASSSEALTIAFETFGARAGADMAAAIREGRLSLDEAMEAMRGAQGSIDDTTESTMDFADRWEVSMNRIKTAFVPVSDLLWETANEAMPAVVDFVESDMVPWLEENLPTALETLETEWDRTWADIRDLTDIYYGYMEGDWERFWAGMNATFNSDAIQLFLDIAARYVTLRETIVREIGIILEWWGKLPWNQGFEAGVSQLQQQWQQAQWSTTPGGLTPGNGIVVNPINQGAIINPMNVGANGQPAPGMTIPAPNLSPRSTMITQNFYGPADAQMTRQSVVDALRSQGMAPR